MIALTLAEIAAVVAGALDGPPDLAVTGPAFVDSRTTEPGGLFVAVPGEHVDGHDYAAAAIRSGAAAVLAQRPVDAPAVVVADVVEALGVLAHHVVTRLDRLTVIGITGSQGKTSTKDIVAQVLESVGATVAPVGSFNNELGVPLTALRATDGTRFLVSEMGARGRGHIEYLASMLRPRVGAVLNVGVAHVGEFGGTAEIALTKGELVESLPSDGVAVLNADDALVAAMAPRTAAPVLTFGRTPGADVRVTDARLDDDGHLALTLGYAGRTADLAVPLVGLHQAGNVAAAAAVGLACGIGWDDVVESLGRVVPRSRWRMELATTPAGVTVLNDAYNANPDSMRAALLTLVEIGSRRDARTVAVLGEMRELGDTSSDAHAAVGRLAVDLGVDILVVVGDGARGVHDVAAQDEAWVGDGVWVDDADAAIRHLEGVVRAGDVVLVKASRAAGLERVAQALVEGSDA